MAYLTLALALFDAACAIGAIILLAMLLADAVKAIIEDGWRSFSRDWFVFAGAVLLFAALGYGFAWGAWKLSQSLWR